MSPIGTFKIISPLLGNPLLTDTPATAFNKICLDTVGPLDRTANGNVHILTMQDNLTKFCLTVAVRNIHATTIADTFAREFIANFGCLRAILFDRGTSFINQIIGKPTKIFKIKQLMTSVYYPLTNGGLEQSNQVFAIYLTHCLRGREYSDTFLPFTMLSYNVLVHESTKFSPYHLVFGKEAGHHINALKSVTDYIGFPIHEITTISHS